MPKEMGGIAEGSKHEQLAPPPKFEAVEEKTKLSPEEQERVAVFNADVKGLIKDAQAELQSLMMSPKEKVEGAAMQSYQDSQIDVLKKRIDQLETQQGLSPENKLRAAALLSIAENPLLSRAMGPKDYSFSGDGSYIIHRLHLNDVPPDMLDKVKLPDGLTKAEFVSSRRRSLAMVPNNVDSLEIDLQGDARNRADSQAMSADIKGSLERSKKIAKKIEVVDYEGRYRL